MKLGDTRIAQSHPWGIMRRRGSKILCSDGKLRAPAYLASTPDSFFSIPAGMKIQGRYVTGYVTTTEDCSPDFQTNRKAFTFQPHTEQPQNPLPEWPTTGTPELWELLAAGETVTHSKA